MIQVHSRNQVAATAENINVLDFPECVAEDRFSFECLLRWSHTTRAVKAENHVTIVFCPSCTVHFDHLSSR
jgi:hypothetical protein